MTTASRRSLFRKPRPAPRLIAWVAVVCVLTVLGFGGLIDWRLDLLGQFRIQLAALAAAAALWAALAGRRVSTLAATTALVGNLVVLAPRLPATLVPAEAAEGGPPADSAGPGGLVLLSHAMSDDPAETGERVLSLIARTAPDLVVLNRARRGGPWLLERLQPRFPHQFTCWDVPGCGTAILSTRPIATSGVLTDDDGAPVPWVRVPAAHRDLTVAAIDVPIPLSSAAAAHRDATIRAASRLAREVIGPVVVTGTFSAAPWAHSVRPLSVAGGLDPVRRLLPSWPAALPWVARLPVDHLYTSPEIRIAVGRLGPDAGSQHLPVLATLSF